MVSLLIFLFAGIVDPTLQLCMSKRGLGGLMGCTPACGAKVGCLGVQPSECKTAVGSQPSCEVGGASKVWTRHPRLQRFHDAAQRHFKILDVLLIEMHQPLAGTRARLIQVRQCDKAASKHLDTFLLHLSRVRD